MRRRLVVTACCALVACGAAGCTGGGAHATTVELRYDDRPSDVTDVAPPSELVAVRAVVKEVRGPYQTPLMSLARPCAVLFRVPIGSIPGNPRSSLVRIEFHQGDRLAQLLQRCDVLCLVFDHSGALVRVDSCGDSS